MSDDQPPSSSPSNTDDDKKGAGDEPPPKVLVRSDDHKVKDDLLPQKNKICCCGVGADVVVIFMHAILLGIDYTVILSASAQYYMYLLNGDDANMTAKNISLLNDGTTIAPILDNNNESFCQPGQSEAETLYANQQTFWAMAQLIGCISGIFLPKLISFKGSFMLFTSLMFAGNLMYAVSTHQIANSWRLAMTGRIVAGLGDGSIVLGLSYIPLHIKEFPVMKTALVNYRMFVAVGTTLGSLVAIGASTFADPTKARINGEFSFNPANFAGFLLAFLAIVMFIAEAACIQSSKPPTKKGAVCSPHWSWKVLAWLFFVFTYGMLMGAIQLAVAIFCFSSTSAAELQTTQAIVLSICFFFALMGAVTSSVLTGKNCSKKMPKDITLKLVQYYVLVIIFGLAFIYAAEHLQGFPSSIGTSAIMITGNVIFFYSVTGLSAAKTPLFKKIVPRSAISATMPLYKICLDMGKAVGPYWTDASFAAGVVDSAFGPYVIIFVLIAVFLFMRGIWMTTPDKPEQAFCYKRETKDESLIGKNPKDQFDPASGGGISKRNISSTATTYEVGDLESNEQRPKSLQMSSVKTENVAPPSEYQQLDSEL